jgi:hypothetical protein
MRVKALLQMLGVSTPKEIFYNNGVLDKVHMLNIVNVKFLGSACPGSTLTEKGNLLFNNRKLSFFKGYGYFDNISLLPSRGMAFVSVTSSWLNGSASSQNEYYYSNYIGGAVHFVFGTTNFPEQLYLDTVINGVVQTGLRIPIYNNGTYTVTLPVNTYYYPDTISFQINT